MMTIALCFGLIGIIIGAMTNSSASVIAGIGLIALVYIGNPDAVKSIFKEDTKQVSVHKIDNNEVKQ